MLNAKTIKTAFIISFIGHSLFLGLPGNINFPNFDKRQETVIRLEIENPALLPKITTLGEEKKLKTPPQTVPHHAHPPEQIMADKFPKASPQQKIEVIEPGQEAMLRYQDMVKQRIEETRRYPSWAKKEGIEGIVYITFIVLSNGLSKDIKINRSANSPLLDAEAVATIKRANPFPPLPKEINTSQAQMEVTIVFRLK